MKVRMLVFISGLRNNKRWPPVGGVLEVGKAEGEKLIHNGYAEKVATVKAVRRKTDRGDTASVEAPEKR